ncbi:DUF3574 domain-containing protein [Falsiroseomonas sp. HC035]|uniref:DUF3574 domain-containing protein n=1 Tax=Falsiroseomonas sp. HC035 TaxID=3390999 RepID=UPI003D31C38A
MRLVYLPLVLLAAACAATPPACPPGLASATRLEGYFGRNANGAEVVTDAAWTRFLDEVVTPAFPDGLTVLDAAGQWRGRTGTVARERSKLLVVAIPGTDAAQAHARLAPVIAAYRSRFGQESVMVTTAPACLGF